MLWRQTSRALLPPPPRAFRSFGSQSAILAPARVERPDCIDIGADVIVQENSWLCVQQHDGLPAPSLRIGNGCRLSRFVKIVSVGQVVLHEGVLLGERSYISDVTLQPHISGGRPDVSRPSPVTIGQHAVIGAGAVIKPGVTVGRHAFVAAAAVVSTDVPDFAMAAGNPARVTVSFHPESTPG